MVRRSVCLGAFVFLYGFSAIAQQYQWEFVRFHETLGKAPVGLFWGAREGNPDSFSTAYVLCVGVDANFNGQPDAEDEPPSLTVAYEEAGGSLSSFNWTFPWGVLSFPVRPAVRREGDRFVLYLPRIDRLTRHTFPPFGQPHEDTVLLGAAQAVLVLGDTLVVSRRASSEEGLILKVLPGVGIVDSFRLGGCPNIQQLLWDSARRQLIVLCEGTFGGNNASVHFLPNAKDSATVIVPVGDTGNFLLLSGDTLVVVANGSHEIFLIDPTTRLWHRMPIAVGTSGYGGPREALLLTLPNGQRTLLVSTYSREVRWIDIATGNILQVLSLTGLAEGMAVRRLGDTLELWVAQVFTPAYAADSVLAVFRLVLPTSVAQKPLQAGQPRVRPTILNEGPVWVEWELSGYGGQMVQAELFSLDGRRCYAWQLPVGESGRLAVLLPLSRPMVPAGSYVLRLVAGDRTALLPLFVY